jgi:hypothetical protein
MSKNEKPKEELEKPQFLTMSDHNALIFIFWMKKSVSIFFWGKNVCKNLLTNIKRNGNPFLHKFPPILLQNL